MKDEKKAFKMSQISPIIIPRIDELSVANIFAMVKEDDRIKPYLPQNYYEKTKPDRQFLLNVINTIYPSFLKELVDGSYNNRHGKEKMAEKEETILATDEWIRQLNELPFSSKVSTTSQIINLFYIEKW